ncbi:hypothetical protein [Streptomyces meridianus]|uniref:Secreted protein n=1 Tax=Streptomyces meridianus TaxID=2938945 RepID=A0ABT0X935_9ACTN|nr:hypothetical protein [Streptomyces meridianus]MCM2579037.1 hypothetical protein [Streptomyces meridianus]
MHAAVLALAASGLALPSTGMAHAAGAPAGKAPRTAPDHTSTSASKSGVQNRVRGNNDDPVVVRVLEKDDRVIRCKAVDRTRNRPVHVKAERRTSGSSTEGQRTTAQSGKQNLDCGNSANLVTANVLSEGVHRTECKAVDTSRRSPTHIKGNTRAAGGTSPASLTTAQAGKQNLNCGNHTGVATANVLSDVQDKTSCSAVDRSTGSPVHGRGEVRATGGDGPIQTNTAQNSRQNSNCGKNSELITAP